MSCVILTFSFVSDVWSAGCVLAELLLGQPIFPGDSGVDQLVEIIKVLGTPTREQIREMNPNYTEFKFPQIKAHPWTKVNGWVHLTKAKQKKRRKRCQATPIIIFKVAFTLSDNENVLFCISVRKQKLSPNVTNTSKLSGSNVGWHRLHGCLRFMWASLRT